MLSELRKWANVLGEGEREKMNTMWRRGGFRLLGGKGSCMRLDIHLFTQINLLDGIVDMIE